MTGLGRRTSRVDFFEDEGARRFGEFRKLGARRFVTGSDMNERGPISPFGPIKQGLAPQRAAGDAWQLLCESL